jgi:hypothetical protein
VSRVAEADDHLEFGPGRKKSLQDAEHEIDIQGSFVGFVDDEGVVFIKHGVCLGFGKEHAVGHDLDESVRAGLVPESNLVAHGPADVLSHSWAMRWAMVMAAILRGWVHPIFPATPLPASRHIFGIWVLFPQPVSPETMTTGFSSMRRMISFALEVMGSVRQR